MVQDPGLLVPDTKFDLVQAPADWLARSLHLWDGEGGLGQVQNQAHGYLWPMGPFYLVLEGLGVPGWAVQRLWQALVLCTALTGMARLARAFGARSDLACIVAAFAYALSPRLLTSLGPISIEVWPSALAPWVLVPLVLGARSGSPRRAAALSGLAVAMTGGVNAAASFAVVPLALVWILTRSRGPRRRALFWWWLLFAALGSLWWILPLFVMGGYSPPFLDFTESSTLTTYPTTLFDALRGTTHWVPYVDLDLRAGNDLIRTGWLAVNTAVVVLVGLVGLLDRRTPQRTFLVLGLLVGVLMVTAGHHGGIEGWGAAGIRDALDGVLGPLRNVHKFDPVLRVPLILGLAFALDRALTAREGARDVGDASGDSDDRARAAEGRARRVNAGVLVGAVVLGVVGSATPALAGRVEPAGAMLGVPAYWEEAADFVADRSRGGNTLLVPGSAFAEYIWGEPQDEPFQYLAESRWTVRQAAILAEPGEIRMLDGLGRRFAEGAGSAGLSEALRRAGIEMLVVRNDLTATDDVPSPALVHQAIDGTPGLYRLAAFGPQIGGDAVVADSEPRTVNDGGRQALYPAIEVFSVSGAQDAVATEDPTVVAGGPEDLADLADVGAVGAAPVRFAADLDPADDAPRPRRVVLTDGLRAKEQQFSRMHDGASATLTPGDVRRTSGRVRDFQLGANTDDRWSTTARLEGAASVAASSSASDADALGGSDRGRLPYAAIDGGEDTAWWSDPVDPRPWWRVGLEASARVTEVRLTAPSEATDQRLRVVTAGGSSEEVEVSPGGTRQVSLTADATTDWVRVESSDGRRVALAEVAVPGLDARRVLTLPRLPETWGSPDVVALRKDHDGRTGCVVVADYPRCAAGTARSGEDGPVLRRSFVLDEARTYDVAVTVRPRAGAGLEALLLRGRFANVVATSTALPDPRAGALSAVDGSVASTWLAAPSDETAGLTLSWLATRRIASVDVDLAETAAARRPTELSLRFRRGERVVERVVDLDAQGEGRFAPVRADGVEMRVIDSEDALDLRRDGTPVDVPVGVGEVAFGGVPFLPITLPTDPVSLSCGSGPDVVVGDRILRTSVTATADQLRGTAPLDATVCGDVGSLALDAGEVRVTAERSAAFDAASVTLTASDDPGPGSVLGVDRSESGPVERTLAGVSDGDTVAVRESANTGWAGDQEGEEVSSVVLDGWQQGFVASGSGPVEMRFAPDTAYRVGLAGGLALVLGLLAGLLWRARPTTHPAVDQIELVPAAGAVLALLTGGLVGGWPGASIAAVVVVASIVLDRSGVRRRRPQLDEALPWLCATPVLLAGLVYALRPWGGTDAWAGSLGWVGYLPLVPLAALFVVGLSERSGKRRLRRMAGRSTTR